MTSGLVVIDEAAVLAAARRFRAESDAAEVGVLEQAIAWALLHEVADDGLSDRWGENPNQLAGEGAPLVAEFCVCDFAAVLGVSTDAGRALIAHGLELVARLPRVLGRVRAGALPVWRARRIAERTIALSPEAAAYVDEQLAPFAHKTGPAAVDRLVEQAVARFMPEQAEQAAVQAREQRHVTVWHDERFGSGTSVIEAALDYADACDFEAAVQTGAEALKAGGSEDTLDVRRAAAVGVMARGQGVLAIAQAAPTSMRELQLFVHLSADQEQISPVATVENGGINVVTRAQVAAWCQIPGTRVIVRPVIDLNQTLTSSGYQPSATLREHIVLRDRTCVFPWCQRTARTADLDHIEPYHPDGPPGQTSSLNLAALCRRHHRLKTHGQWTYTQLEPGIFLWRSPHGYTYLRDHEGTQDLTPRPVDPPGG